MKAVFLLSALITTTLCKVNFKLIADGILQCPKPFNVRVNIWEVDNFVHDAVSGVRPYEEGQLFLTYTENPALTPVWERYFKIWGAASESWPGDNEVELVMTIEHTCATDYACVCHDFGSRSKGFYESIDFVTLSNTTMKVCSMCDYAKGH